MELGVDIEEVARFRPLIRQKKFLNRIFTPTEISYCRKKKNAAQHFAVRFAAKEAVWKALSAVVRRRRISLGHRQIGVQNLKSGKPVVSLPSALRSYEKKLIISLSHTKSTVVAVAALK